VPEAISRSLASRTATSRRISPSIAQAAMTVVADPVHHGTPWRCFSCLAAGLTEALHVGISPGSCPGRERPEPDRDQQAP
jgi:hypothetical protein